MGRGAEVVRGFADLNEFDVIRRIRELLPDTPPEVKVPVGDDCAVFETGGEFWVAAADMLVEGRHFKGWAAPEDVGYKAVAVNASDVAAMGATPRFVLASGGSPSPETSLACFEGVMEACREFGIYPLGGDTTSADSLVVDVSILGSLKGKPVLRSGAGVGDLLAVTGELGASVAGLLAFEKGIGGWGRLGSKHLRPQPRMEAGVVAARLGATAMIDVSDGLASDIRHICEASGVGCRIDLESLPVSADTEEFLRSIGEDPLRLAATGGEDYELLIAAPQDVLDKLLYSTDTPITVIGEFVGREPEFLRDGEKVDGLSGWDHFV